MSERNGNKVKMNYDLSTPVVLFKVPKPSGPGRWPYKLICIMQSVFTHVSLHHARFKRENGMHVFYLEGYKPLDTTKVDYEKANKYGVEWVQLEDNIPDEAYTYYKILIRNPGRLRKRDLSIGFHGI